MKFRLTHTWYPLCVYHFEKAKKKVKAGWCEAFNPACAWDGCVRTGMFEFYPIGKRELAETKKRKSAGK